MSKKRRLRRLWEDDEKIRIVAQTQVPGVSVSQVARRYDVNANLVFRWLIETAKLNGVDHQAWLTDVLDHISDHKITKLDELLPWRYAEASA